MGITQLAVGLKKQDQNDKAWHAALNSGFDDNNTRLTLAGAASPEGVTTGHWVGQRYWDTTNKRWFVFTGTPTQNTGWIVEKATNAGTVAARGTAFANPVEGNLWALNRTKNKLLQVFVGSGPGAWENFFGYEMGSEAELPVDDLQDGFVFFNTDKKHPVGRVAGNWVDFWPEIKLEKAESTYAFTSYGAAFVYVKETGGVNDLNVVVTTPAVGQWRIIAVGNVVANGPGGSSKAVLQAELHRNAVFVGTRGGTGFPDIAAIHSIAASCFDIFTTPAASTAYTYKLRAASQVNNCQSVAAGIYVGMIRVG